MSISLNVTITKLNPPMEAGGRKYEYKVEYKENDGTVYEMYHCETPKDVTWHINNDSAEFGIAGINITKVGF